MNKSSIKIIKRQAETVAETNSEPEVLDSSLKARRLARREIVKTITGWIDEQLEQNRLAEVIAGRMIAGNSPTSQGRKSDEQSLRLNGNSCSSAN